MNVLKAREEYYNTSSHTYLMALDNNYIIDAYQYGSLGRFINHSCNPNCYVELYIDQDLPRMLIFSLCDIQAKSELTYNYAMNIKEIKGVLLKCVC